jgi:hypothetical protein
MTTHLRPVDEAVTPSTGSAHPRRAAARSLLVLAVPTVVYFAVRPSVGTDAVALAIAGAVPLTYQVALVLWRRRVELLAVLTSVGFAVGCLVSLLAGGSSLPLKLHEAVATFVVGIVLLAAVLIRRPLPVGRLLKVARADRPLDTTLSVMVGGFLVLHALLHVALAVSLSTPTYLVAGRILNSTTLAVGALCLYVYVRRARRHAIGDRLPPTSKPSRSDR